MALKGNLRDFTITQLLNLINLASNAIKFTEIGQVILEVNCLKNSRGKVELEFKIDKCYGEWIY